MPWATWLLFTGVPARCVVLCLRCPGPLGSCQPVCTRGVLCCLCSVLGHLAPVHQCARSVCCVACAVIRATWHLFTAVYAPRFALCVPSPGPSGSCSRLCTLGVLSCVWVPGPVHSCSPVCTLSVLCCMCGVLGHLAPVHRFVHSACCVVCAASWATWLLFIGVPARCVVLCVPCHWPLGSCSSVRTLGVLCCVCGVLVQLAPVHRCARSVCSALCVVSWGSWLLFIGVQARPVVLCVGTPGPVGSCSPMCTPGMLHFLCGVPGHLCSCSPVCTLGVWRCLCGVLSHFAPVHRCVRSA